MSESEGLAKLAEYLKQTRRQAEAAIDHLNEQINVLNQAIDERDEKLHRAHEEIRDLKLSIVKMQEDKSMKSVFKERDDWKSLVDSIQKDRGRLQQENTSLQQSLEEASSEISRLKQRLLAMEQERESLTLTQLPLEDDHSRLAVTDNSMPMSPIIDRSGNTILVPEGTPHSLAQKLKEELKRVHRQMEEERRQSAMEQSAKLAEINRLRVQLQANAGIVTAQPATAPAKRPGKPVSGAQSSGGVSWLGSLLGFYSPSVAASAAGSTKKIGYVPRVLKV